MKAANTTYENGNAAIRRVYYGKSAVFSVFNLFLLFTGLILLASILIVKSETALLFWEYPLLFTYSIFITTFQLGRIAMSFAYKSPSRQGQFDVLGKEYMPAVTFVVPCKNEEKAIESTITRCFDVYYPKHLIEVIVINDGSTDRTGEILENLKARFENLTVIQWKKNQGKRKAMIEGFRRAKGEIIVQMDSDSYVDAETFYNLIKPFSDSGIGAVCAHSDPANADKNFLTRMQSAYYFMSFRILKSVESVLETVFCCSGCASAYRKSVVLAVLDRWLNEKFLGQPVTYGDDRALTSWVLKSGYRTVYAYDAKAFTIVPENFRQLMVQQLRWKKSWIINAFLTGRFLYRSNPLVAFYYFFPLVLISFINPFVGIYSIVYVPFFHLTMPWFYFLGTLLVYALVAVVYAFHARKENRYWPYLFGWLVINIFILTPMIIYAALKIQDRGWGTR